MSSHRILGAVGAIAIAAHAGRSEAASFSFQQTNFASDIPRLARHTDPNLVNAWGIVPAAGLLWIANNGTDTAVAYRQNGQPFPSAAYPFVIDVPGAPTGVAHNPTSGFVIYEDGRSGPAFLLFGTESGTILGYNPVVDRTHAVVAVDNSASEANYKGIALAPAPGGGVLFAANFHDRVVEMYDSRFHLIDVFTDDTLPDSYSPFNVAVLGGRLFVAFAKPAPPDFEDEEAGPGLGFVDEFTTDGTFVRRIASGGALNAPWGMELAPGGTLLVGNFGDGWINAFRLATGAFLGPLRSPRGAPIAIDGLWGITFGAPTSYGGRPELFFAAGIDDEAHGLFGVLRPRNLY